MTDRVLGHRWATFGAPFRQVLSKYCVRIGQVLKVSNMCFKDALKVL